MLVGVLNCLLLGDANLGIEGIEPFCGGNNPEVVGNLGL